MLYQSFILFSSNSLILKYKHFTHLDTRAGVFQGKFDVCRGLYERTGCPPIFVYPLTKILWFKEGKGFRDFKRITFVKDYIIYRLSNTWIRMTSAFRCCGGGSKSSRIL